MVGAWMPCGRNGCWHCQQPDGRAGSRRRRAGDHRPSHYLDRHFKGIKAIGVTSVRELVPGWAEAVFGNHPLGETADAVAPFSPSPVDEVD